MSYTDWTTRVWFLAEAMDFSSSLCVQTSYWGPPSLLSSGYWESFPGGKEWPGRDAEHSPPSSAEVENEWKIHLLSPLAPAWRVWDIFTFTYKTNTPWTWSNVVFTSDRFPLLPHVHSSRLEECVSVCHANTNSVSGMSLYRYI
jgi:hypothetical protein